MPDNKPNKHDFLDQLSTTALENLIMLSAESDDPSPEPHPAAVVATIVAASKILINLFFIFAPP